ncbi:MAG: hypothetical protein ACMVO3_10620 [Thalassobaculum sp.]
MDRKSVGIKELIELRRRRILKYGAWGTALWLWFLAFVILKQYGYVWSEVSDPLSSYELGDTFSGFFGALGFFWLVLGYFQQAEEIRLNRLDLSLQIDQLAKQSEATEKSTISLESQASALSDSVKVSLFSGYLSILPENLKFLDNLAWAIFESLKYNIDPNLLSRKDLIDILTQVLDLNVFKSYLKDHHNGTMDSLSYKILTDNIIHYVVTYREITKLGFDVVEENKISEILKYTRYGSLYEELLDIYNFIDGDEIAKYPVRNRAVT